MARCERDGHAGAADRHTHTHTHTHAQAHTHTHRHTHTQARSLVTPSVNRCPPRTCSTTRSRQQAKIAAQSPPVVQLLSAANGSFLSQARSRRSPSPSWRWRRRALFTPLLRTPLPLTPTTLLSHLRSSHLCSPHPLSDSPLHTYTLHAPALHTCRCVNVAFETSLAEGLRFERAIFYSTFATHDQKAGMAAFAAKEKPNFKNE